MRSTTSRQSKSYKVGENVIYVNELGANDAPVVVLLHGLIMSARYMLPLADALADQWRVFAPDLPGFGRSKSKSILNTEQLGHALVEWINVAGLSDVTLVSNSYGSQIAVEAEIAAPDLFKALVMIGPTVDDKAPRQLLQILRMASQFWREPLWFWFTALSDLYHCGLRRALVTLRHLVVHNMIERARLVRAPVTIIRGQHDAVCPPAWAKRLSDATGNGAVIVIDDVAHVAQTRRPQKIAEHIKPGSIAAD